MATETNFSFDFTESQPTKELKLQGGAHYPKDIACLRLTESNSADSTPLERSSGRAIYNKRVIFSKQGKQAEFESTITFVIKPPNSNDPTPADGLVFFIAPFGHAFPSNTHGGNLGIFGLSGRAPKVVAIEFDIYVNQWDPQFAPHLGIDIESRTSKKSKNIPSSYIGNEVTLSIKYACGEISATVATDSDPNGVTVSLNYDLSTILPPEVEVGLAASTGDLVAFHDALAWEFSSALVDKEDA